MPLNSDSCRIMLDKVWITIMKYIVNAKLILKKNFASQSGVKVVTMTFIMHTQRQYTFQTYDCRARIIVLDAPKS